MGLSGELIVLIDKVLLRFMISGAEMTGIEGQPKV